MELEFVIFDTETTGLLQPMNSPLHVQPKIIEFYGVRLNQDFEIIRTVNQLIYPEESITPEITRITGITDAMVSVKPTFSEVAVDIDRLFIGANLSVAHNISFDNGMLDVEFKRMGFDRPFARHDLCTVEATMCLKGFRMSLLRLHQHIFNSAFKAHRAEDDVHALVRIFHHLTETGVVNLEHYSN